MIESSCSQTNPNELCLFSQPELELRLRASGWKPENFEWLGELCQQFKPGPNRAHRQSLDELLACFTGPQNFQLHLALLPGETLLGGLWRLSRAAVDMARHGVQLLVLDDERAFRLRQTRIDPILAVGMVNWALSQRLIDPEPWSVAFPKAVCLRSRTWVALRSGVLRNWREQQVALSVGADVVVSFAPGEMI